MQVSIDVHFGYGAVLGAGVSGGILIGLYANEAVSIPIFIAMGGLYGGCLLLAVLVHRSNQNYRMEKAVREYQGAERQKSLEEYQMNPLKLEPVDAHLSSLRR